MINAIAAHKQMNVFKLIFRMLSPPVLTLLLFRQVLRYLFATQGKFRLQS